MYLQDQWKVPTSGGIGMNAIRNVNKFINESEAKIAAGKVTGTPEQINQYMGEAYFIRAMLYYSKLQDYGDFPIELKELNVNNDLVEASKRQPRNLVARQILSDMDKAIDKLQVTIANKVRINKNAALAMKSRMALYEATSRSITEELVVCQVMLTGQVRTRNGTRTSLSIRMMK